MPDQGEEGGQAGQVEQHHAEHHHQAQPRAGVLSPVVMVTLLPDTDHDTVIELGSVIITRLARGRGAPHTGHCTQ